MKRFILIGMFFLGLSLNAQNKGELIIGLSYGTNSVIIDEAANPYNIDGNNFNSIDLRYSYTISKSLRKSNSWGLETGVMYSKHSFTINEILDNNYEELSLISIPIYAKLNFFTYFYASAGPIISFEVSTKKTRYASEQNGVGLGVELGGKYKLNKSFGLQLGALINQYNLVQFSQDKSHDAVNEIGLKLALSYAF